MNFIKRMILENWTDVSEHDSEYVSLWGIFNDEDNITWQEFIEEDIETLEPTVVSRIVTLKYEGFNSAGYDIHSYEVKYKKLN